MKTQTPAATVTSAPPPKQGRFDAREVELKFFLDDAAFKTAQQCALLGGPATHKAQRLRSVYFDTDRGDLWQQRTFLRMRSQRGKQLLAMKADGADAANPLLRREIEVPSPSAQPDPALLGDAAAAEVMRLTEGRPLLPRFTTDIRRMVHWVMWRGSEIEASFDTGCIAVGDARHPVRELELELKSGNTADLLGLGVALSDVAPIRLGVMSKGGRGMMLASGAAPAAVRANVQGSADYSVDDVIATTIGDCIRQFIGNWPAFEAADGPEAVHQMRVSMRRLRAVLAIFQRGFPCVEFGEFRGEAKRIASAMAEGRNWDVFADLVRAGPAVAFKDEPGFEELLRASGVHRAAGYEAVGGLLKDVATTRFVLSALGFVARRGWRNSVAGAELRRLSAPAAEFAALSLARLHRRVRKRGKHILDMSADDRHQLRVALKRLRYATDFFGCLFANASAVRGYARASARLQDILGTLNDTVMVTDLVRRLDLGDDPASACACGIVIGWYGRGAGADARDLHHAWDSFRDAKPFWNDALPPEADDAAS